MGNENRRHQMKTDAIEIVMLKPQQIPTTVLGSLRSSRTGCLK